ncbi:MAG: tetratricopeptide repeat protein [Bacteroidota bacterium]
MKKLSAISLFIGFTILVNVSSFAQRKKSKQNTKPTQEQIDLEAEYQFIEAEKLYILKNYSQAIVLLNKCLALDPDNDVFYYKLADINNVTEQYSQAAGYITKAIDINPKNKFYYLLAVDIQTNLGNLLKAAQYYEDMIRIIPGTENYLLDLAANYIYQQNFDKAIDTYDRAEKAFGLTEQISFQKQKVYLQQNKLDEAIAESEQLIKKYPDNPRYVVMQSEILSSNNRLEEAGGKLEILLETNPDYAVARLQLADIYWKQNNFEGFQNQLMLAFSNIDLFINAKINTIMKYMVFLPNVQLEKIIPGLVDRIINIHPDNRNSYLIAGDVYSTFIEKQLVTGDEIKAVTEKAADAYAVYVELDPSNFSVWQNLLNLELQLDRQEELAKHASEALELFPNQAWIYLVNGIVEENQNNHESAAVMLEMGSKRASNNKGLLTLINSYLGDIYHELKEYEKSDKAYEAVLEIDPLNFPVLNNYSYYLSLRGEKLDLAKKMSTTLIRNNPDNNTYLDTYAWVRFALGELEEAERIFSKIIASGVDEGVYYDHFGDVLYKLNKVEEAVEQWKKARELDKNIENIDQKIKERKLIQ